jgi:tellurite resistance protein TehA-like permease
MKRQIVFRTAALGAAGAGLYHLIAIVEPSLIPGGAFWRHGIFAVVDLACAPLLLKRPRWFVFAFAALTLETILSHGGHALRAWQQQKHVDWFSSAVVVAVCLAMSLLTWDATSRE